MQLDISFFTGLGCGVCLGISIFALRRIFGIGQAIRLFKSNKEFKLVLVVRSDLNMSKGKIAAQCGHAAVGAFEKALKKYPEGLESWKSTGQAKIALKCDSLEEMNSIASMAKQNGVITSMIRDAGRTQIAAGSVTVLGVGPAPKDVIDKITGHLKLL